jgi:hypothetical protein
MKKTIYWIIRRSQKHGDQTTYYLYKEDVVHILKMIRKHEENSGGLVEAYKLRVTFTNEILENLLNKEFTPKFFANYHKAKSIN